MDSLNRRGEDPIGGLELRLNPDLKNTLMELCSDPKTTIVVLSGSNKLVLDGVNPLATSSLIIIFAFCYCHVDVLSFTELLSVQNVVGGREWDFFAICDGRMDDIYTRALKYGLD